MGIQIPCLLGDTKNTEGVPKSLGDLTWGCQIHWGARSPMTPDANFYLTHTFLLFDEPRPSFMKFHFLAASELLWAICQCIELLALFQQEKIYVQHILHIGTIPT